MVANEERIKALSEQHAEKLLGTEKLRVRVNEIITDYVNHVEFMKKVREYAGMEIDHRLFHSVRYWSALIFAAVLTSAVGWLSGHFLK